MRWYGKFRNDGKYNSSGLFKIRDKMEQLYEADQFFRSKIAAWYPTTDFLYKEKERELKKDKKTVKGVALDTSRLKGSEIDLDKDVLFQLYGQDEKSITPGFFFYMLEPGSCLIRPKNFTHPNASKITLILLTKSHQDALKNAKKENQYSDDEDKDLEDLSLEELKENQARKLIIAKGQDKENEITSDEQILKLFKKYQVPFSTLDPNIPPIYKVNSGWFSKKGGSILDLTYRALAMRRLAIEEK